MTRKLILVRHAKSSWDSLGLPDHDRPLNARGRASAVAIGKWLRDQGWTPDQILTSSSARTLETLDLMGFDAPAVVTRDLYHASAHRMLDQLSTATGHKVLMLGHNPGIGEFAERLARKLPGHARFLDYPTCATTLFEFTIDDWKDVALGSGEVKAFTVPRDLI